MAHKEQESAATSDNNTLQRTLGLTAATSIGIGTMVGAGIFVFPGLAGGYAGPAAILSFAIGCVIALLVALCTAELATVMPKSGGGYLFISRAFGSFQGFTAGICQWLGLVFASAFYLAGFAHYTLELLRRFHISSTSVVISVGAVLILLTINIIGTKKAGKLQNIAVILLSLLLSVIFVYGLLDIVGITGNQRLFSDFTPNGYQPVFTTTALIFTAYLGFVQISTVAGEIKKPEQNLPRALILSVVVVFALYILVLFVSTSLYSASELKALGETATLDVARKLLGNGGALIVLIAGILATLSSANASIMSSSRSLFALAKDGMAPQQIKRLNNKFNTPHVALLLVVIPVIALLFVGDLEFFAEVASFFHLVLYAGICLSLLRFRRRNEDWYTPPFRIYAGQIVAVAGAIGCAGITFFMQTYSILTGIIIIVITSVCYAIFHRDTSASDPDSSS
ncbi:APC family permease [Arsukibacterium sp.]|uniref:APC family permease n=1 Tax=Arsukibacterium sp. TaxID=1977258 RepID=UPI00299E9BDB|nr:APC family permease [Arsukibacterium sp.]MDX1676256.1 APC family permease [Arsukibacterium sp.]